MKPFTVCEWRGILKFLPLHPEEQREPEGQGGRIFKLKIGSPKTPGSICVDIHVDSGLVKDEGREYEALEGDIDLREEKSTYRDIQRIIAGKADDKAMVLIRLNPPPQNTIHLMSPRMTERACKHRGSRVFFAQCPECGQLCFAGEDTSIAIDSPENRHPNEGSTHTWETLQEEDGVRIVATGTRVREKAETVSHFLVIMGKGAEIRIEERYKNTVVRFGILTFNEDRLYFLGEDDNNSSQGIELQPSSYELLFPDDIAPGSSDIDLI